MLFGDALQRFDFKFAADILAHYHDDGFPTDPEEITVSSSGFSGFYRVSGDSNIYIFNAYSSTHGNYVMCDSPHFSIRLASPGASYTGTPYISGDRIGIHFNTESLYSVWYNLVDDKGFFNSWSGYSNFESPNNIAYTEIRNNNNIQTFTRGSTMPHTAKGPSFNNGVSVTLPSDTMNTGAPWEYYNDTLLPYLKNEVYVNLPDDIDINQLLVFPNGYHVQDPTEPPTFPKGNLWIGDYYDIDVNIVTVTDENGEPVTDVEGETVTETQIVT